MYFSCVVFSMSAKQLAVKTSLSCFWWGVKLFTLVHSRDYVHKRLMLCFGTARRSAPPLDIVGLPGYERLTDAEKQAS